MAKLIPPYIDKTCKSTGEKLIFEILKKNKFSKDWIILHSLNLSQHTRRLYGEIDFLLMIPRGGIYVMEVKGGDVTCIDGEWYYTDRYGNINVNKSPFNQARDAMFSLQNSIRQEFGHRHEFTQIITGFLCAFPHISFNKHSVEYEQWQILDKDTLEVGLEQFFSNLVEKNILKHRNQRWFSENQSLPEHDKLQSLSNFLRGDFERVRSIGERTKEFDKDVRRYTEEQYRILDSIQMNERCLIQGSAGTGKTMIAIESAIRAAEDGKKVFLTCFNRLIGEWMKEQVADYSDRITASSLHSYLIDLSKGFDYDKSKMNDNDFYSSYLPHLLKEMYDKSIFKKFDKLIVDEGQDLIRREYLELFNAMIFPGLNEGNWEIYGDFEKQAIFSSFSKKQMLDQLKIYATSSKFLLKINCRNTKQIGEETSLISGFEKPPFLLEYLEGIPVEYVFYENKTHQEQLISHHLSKLIDGKLSKKEIVIISPKKFNHSSVSLISSHSISELRSGHKKKLQPETFDFATIQSYKGMESNYVFITDIDDLLSPIAVKLLYVGMTRAKYGLILFVSESIRNQFKEILSRKLN